MTILTSSLVALKKEYNNLKNKSTKLRDMHYLLYLIYGKISRQNKNGRGTSASQEEVSWVKATRVVCRVECNREVTSDSDLNVENLSGVETQISPTKTAYPFSGGFQPPNSSQELIFPFYSAEFAQLWVGNDPSGSGNLR